MPHQNCPEGLALYLRHYSHREHGTPRELMKKHRDHGAKWIAVAGPWFDERGNRFINDPTTCRKLLDAAYDADLDPYVWGYPWKGREERFADAMALCAGEYNMALLDPELGANPERARSGRGKTAANEAAELLVQLMAARFPGGVCGLSTFGSGVRMAWFPLYAFARALAFWFPERTFLGGQTYTEDPRVDPSIADFLKAIDACGGLEVIDLVPNFGTYAWKNTKPGEKRRARPKTGVEMDAHFMEFIDEGEPVEAMIGWAENFMTEELWRSFAKMAERMERGACRLP